MKVIAGVYSGVTTVELDTLAAETAASLTTKHPDYAILAARIAVSNLHKETKKLFSCKSVLKSQIFFYHSLFPFPAVMDDLFNYVHPVTKKWSPMISKETHDIIMANAEVKSDCDGHTIVL